MTVLRSTQEVYLALVSYTSNLRITQITNLVAVSYNAPTRISKQFSEVLLQEPAGDVRISKQFVEVLLLPSSIELLVADINGSATLSANLNRVEKLEASITCTALVSASLGYAPKILSVSIIGTGHLAAELDDLPPTGAVRQFVANINGSLNLTPNLKLPTLQADINSTATVTAKLTGIQQLEASIDATGSFEGNLLSYVKLTASVSSTTTVAANLRENIEYLAADISGIGFVGTAIDVDPPVNVPWHAGSTLQWTQEALAELVLDFDVTDTLNLSDTLTLIFGQRSFYPSNTLSFIDSAETDRVLPDQTASSTLNLTQLLTETRQCTSYLILIQSATGVVTYLSGIATSNLNLTDTVSTSQSIFAVDASSQLDLDSEGYPAAVAERAPEGSTLYLFDHAYGALLEYRFVDYTYGTPTTSSEIIREQAHRNYVILQAPYSGIQATLILPAPLFGDTENIISNLTLRKSINGTKRTYVKTSDSKVLKYTFSLDRLIGLALEGFIDSYNGAQMRLTNWKGEVWRVNLMTNPVDFVQTHKAEPGGDRTEVNLEFEGIKIDG